MNSPEQLREKLAKQWRNKAFRLQRLLDASVWPLELSIGKASAREIESSLQAVKQHIKTWQSVSEGEVRWQEFSYRGLAEPLLLPISWILQRPSQWVKACADPQVQSEFSSLESVLPDALPVFRELLIDKLSLWRDKSREEIRRCLHLAQVLEPSCADGRPLRALADYEVDTKFFERNERLLLALLDLRFEGQVSEQGLQTFLGAQTTDDHWLLIVDLDGSLLPFSRLRLSTQQLQQSELPAKTLLVVENEQCEHHLPKLAGTLAVLGSGRDLNWLGAEVIASKNLIYWGDLDTWGLQMLAQVRRLRPDVQALLMDEATFSRYSDKNAVPEPVKASESVPEGLTEAEAILYRKLWQSERGRLEQEFISAEQLAKAISSYL